MYFSIKDGACVYWVHTLDALEVWWSADKDVCVHRKGCYWNSYEKKYEVVPTKLDAPMNVELVLCFHRAQKKDLPTPDEEGGSF